MFAGARGTHEIHRYWDPYKLDCHRQRDYSRGESGKKEMKFPPEWIPTFIEVGILLLVGYVLLFLDWLADEKKSGASKTGM